MRDIRSRNGMSNKGIKVEDFRLYNLEVEVEVGVEVKVEVEVECEVEVEVDRFFKYISRSS